MSLADRIRSHAHSGLGKMAFVNCARNDVYSALASHLDFHRGEYSAHLSPDERRMFCLFVAEAIENPTHQE